MAPHCVELQKVCVFLVIFFLLVLVLSKRVLCFSSTGRGEVGLVRFCVYVCILLQTS